jgi:thiamine biosynthesis protein ThiS
MKLVINGQPRELAPVATLAALLETLGLDPKAVVVERNREIVRRARLGETPLTDGDAIELVHFVGGG